MGPRGAQFTVGPRGTRTTVGIPGTDLSYTTYSSHHARRAAESTRKAGDHCVPRNVRLFTFAIGAHGASRLTRPGHNAPTIRPLNSSLRRLEKVGRHFILQAPGDCDGPISLVTDIGCTSEKQKRGRPDRIANRTLANE